MTAENFQINMSALQNDNQPQLANSVENLKDNLLENNIQNSIQTSAQSQNQFQPPKQSANQNQMPIQTSNQNQTPNQPQKKSPNHAEKKDEEKEILCSSCYEALGKPEGYSHEEDGWRVKDELHGIGAVLGTVASGLGGGVASFGGATTLGILNGAFYVSALVNPLTLGIGVIGGAGALIYGATKCFAKIECKNKNCLSHGVYKVATYKLKK